MTRRYPAPQAIEFFGMKRKPPRPAGIRLFEGVIGHELRIAAPVLRDKIEDNSGMQGKEIIQLDQTWRVAGDTSVTVQTPPG